MDIDFNDWMVKKLQERAGERKYKVTISHVVELKAENADEAKNKAVELFEIGPQLITSVECEQVQ